MRAGNERVEMTADLQELLGLEHEAVWLYAVIGARFEALATEARHSYNAHVTQRDDLLARGATPVATELSYNVGQLRSTHDARKIARSIESRIASACLTLVGDSAGPGRDFATTALRRAALAELAWGARLSAFPGLP